MTDRRFDVAILGAGIIGASIAYHLARGGGRGIAVLEKESGAGTGSTAKAAGGIRAQFASEINIDLSRLSIERFERFPQEMGVDTTFIQAGYLWMTSRADEMKLFERNAAIQRKHGLDIEVLDAKGVAKKAPYVKVDDIVGGTFHAKDGYGSPADFLQGYEKKARELGVAFLFQHEALGRAGRTLRTTGGNVTADKVVIAAGAWSGKLGRTLGFEIPVEPVRRQCFVTEPLPALPHPIPMTVDYTSGIYMHSESGGVLLGKADKNESPGFNETVDYAFLERVAELAMQRVPALEQARIKTGWGGLYEVTPDHHPVIGELGEGFYACCGFSGHGVMHAPAAGMLTAELLLTGRTSSLDIAGLGLRRFKEGNLIHETHVI